MGILQRKCRTTGKKALAYRGKRWPKYRYCFSCLQVRGGFLSSYTSNEKSAHHMGRATARLLRRVLDDKTAFEKCTKKGDLRKCLAWVLEGRKGSKKGS